jgi:PKD repeat protein
MGGTAPYVYNWTFGDGTTGGNNLSLPAESFTHRYASAGNYTARLTLTDAVGISRFAIANLTVKSVESTPGNGTSPPPTGLSESTLLAIGAGVGLAISVVAVIGVLYSRRRRQVPPRGDAPP